MAWKGSTTGIAVANGSTGTILTIPIREGASKLTFQLDNDAHKALDVFAVQIAVLSDSIADFITVANAASDFKAVTSDVGNPWIEYASVSPVTLALSTSALVRVNVRGVGYVRLLGSAGASSDTMVGVHWQVR